MFQHSVDYSPPREHNIGTSTTKWHTLAPFRFPPGVENLSVAFHSPQRIVFGFFKLVQEVAWVWTRIFKRTGQFKISKTKIQTADLDTHLVKRPLGTGKVLSKAFIFASTNPQYEYRLSIELRVQYMKVPSSEHKLF